MLLGAIAEGKRLVTTETVPTLTAVPLEVLPPEQGGDGERIDHV